MPRILIAFLTLALFVACGGGSDVAGGGTGGTGISSGPISGFGSVFVAGTKLTSTLVKPFMGVDLALDRAVPGAAAWLCSLRSVPNWKWLWRTSLPLLTASILLCLT